MLTHPTAAPGPRREILECGVTLAHTEQWVSVISGKRGVLTSSDWNQINTEGLVVPHFLDLEHESIIAGSA